MRRALRTTFGVAAVFIGLFIIIFIRNWKRFPARHSFDLPVPNDAANSQYCRNALTLESPEASALNKKANVTPDEVGPPQYLCESKECLAKEANTTIENFCSLNHRRFDCLEEIISCCDELKSTCLTKGINYDYTCGFKLAEVDCYELPIECLAKKADQSVKTFCDYHPGKDECKGGERGNTMIAVRLSKSKGYTKFTASVIKEIQNIHPEDIYLFGNDSRNFDETDLRFWYGEKANVIAHETGSEQYFAERALTRFILSDYDVLFLTDSESILQPHWRSFVDKNLNIHKIDFMSLYHSSDMHDYTEDCPKFVGSMCEGPVIGRLGVVMTKSFAQVALKKHLQSFKHLNWTDLLKKENIVPRYPRKSLIMRISQTNQDQDNCGENEVPYRFNRCSFPSWVKDGIEFYFDRCTSPNEEYDPHYSIPKIQIRRRQWVRPAIAYILYGSHPRYTKRALANAARVFSVYPGWKIWIYTDWSSPKDVMARLCEYDVHMVDMRLTSIKSRRSWRLLIASEPVKMFAVRDIDSHLIPREKAAVDEWIRSGRKFHVMRDHPNHSRLPMNVGMWGAVGNAIPQMRQLLVCAVTTDYYMQDSDFLRDVIWPIANTSVWVHDSHSLNIFGEDHPFPLDMPKNSDYVGSVVSWK